MELVRNPSGGSLTSSAVTVNWWAVSDSNTPPKDYESSALTK